MTAHGHRVEATLWGAGRAPEPDVLSYTAADDRVWDARLLRWDILGSLGHVEGLHASGLLTQREFRSLVSQLRAALRAVDSGKLAVGHANEDVHTSVERWITRRDRAAGERLHTGRSRNEQVALDLRLYLKDRLLEAHSKGADLARALLVFAARHKDVVWPGYTHLRRAMPTTAGLWAAGYAEGLIDTLEAFPALWTQLDRSPLGTGAGHGVPLPLDRQAAARALGFGGLVTTAPAAQNVRGKIEAAVLSWCTQLGHEIARLATDAIVYGAEEYGFLVLPRALATGSSLMPQKQNPDVFELTRARAAALDGDLAMVLRLKAGLTGGYHRDLQLLKEPLFRGLDRTEAMLTMMTRAVGELDVDRAKGRETLQGMMATDELIRRTTEGTPFRAAYREVKKELAENVERGAVATPPPDREILARREALGSPGNPGLDLLRNRLTACRRWAAHKRRRFDRAMTLLADDPRPRSPARTRQGSRAR